MIYIKYFEAIQTEKLFQLNTEDIEDMLLPITDMEFRIKSIERVNYNYIDGNFMNDTSIKNIVKNNCYPTYKVILSNVIDNDDDDWPLVPGDDCNYSSNNTKIYKEIVNTIDQIYKHKGIYGVKWDINKDDQDSIEIILYIITNPNVEPTNKRVILSDEYKLRYEKKLSEYLSKILNNISERKLTESMRKFHLASIKDKNKGKIILFYGDVSTRTYNLNYDRVDDKKITIDCEYGRDNGRLVHLYIECLLSMYEVDPDTFNKEHPEYNMDKNTNFHKATTAIEIKFDMNKLIKLVKTQIKREFNG